MILSSSLSVPAPTMVLQHTAKMTTNERRITRVVISYNAAACKHIQNSEYDRSIKLISTAIRLFKKSAITARTENQIREENKKGGVSRVLPSVDAFMTSFPAAVGGIFGREGHPEHHPLKSNKSGDRLDNHENVTAYCLPIQLPSTLGDSAGSDHLASTSLTIIPPILFFNLSLAYHLKGIYTQENDILSKAATMYGSTFRLERIRCKKYDIFSSPLFLASILNNIGHIHQQRRQFQDYGPSPTKTSQFSSFSTTPPPAAPEVVYFQRLFTMLTYLVQSRRICRSQYSGFFENCVAGMSSQKSINCAGAA